MPPMLDVSDEVRAEIGDEEAERLLAGDSAPDTYDCTSCRAPGDTGREPTSTVLFVGEETAVLAFAHATCIPSQIVPVSEQQLQDAVSGITGADGGALGPAAETATGPQQAVLGVTCGLLLCQDVLHSALVVEPTAGVTRPGSTGGGDEFLPLLIEQGFLPVNDLETPPSPLPGWSVLLAAGQLHAIMMPPLPGAASSAWWQAHQAMQVSEGWRSTVNRSNEVYVYAAPAGTVGHQPREDLLREALVRAAERGLLVGGVMPLAGT